MPRSAAAAAGLALRFRGRLADLAPADRTALFDRTTTNDEAVRDQVAAILDAVRAMGDEALRGLAAELDGVVLAELEVPRAEWTRALDALDPALRAALDRAVANITTVHEAFRPVPQEVQVAPGLVVGRRPDPLDRVGVYAPGGRAAYPSSLLMGVVPARIAGVREVIVCSPPARHTKRPLDVVLAAAALGGADRVFSLGGAGAVAAMAYGTPTVPRVQRIVGPGNAWVAEAKVQVANTVAIDSPAGPSELLVLADDTADPSAVARELCAQAEHDPKACVVAVVRSATFAAKLIDVLGVLATAQPRAGIVIEALASAGGVLVAESLDEQVTFANDYAAEHLQLQCADAGPMLARLKNAGTVFVGASASVAFGDYMTGANHVLPTGGLARSFSGLSTLDFVRWTTWQTVSPTAARALAEPVGLFADAEGLPGHAAAARAWGGAGGGA
ncbi:MAG: histidinol dehydrogenase [Gemmatimonadaceae bacterium]|nr:histidinol dehydrogenase [Gemmatimonadaceae bacterium]